MAATKGKTGKTTKNKAKKPENKADSKAVTAADKQELLPYNPLLSNPVILSEDENEQKVQLINETESLIELNEQKLTAEKRKAKLEIEVHKIKSAKSLSKVINNLIDLGLTEEVLLRIIRSLNTAYDFKMYTEGIKNLTETRNKNEEAIIQDEFGRRKRTKIIAEFRTATGEEARIAAELPGSD
jgi:hypothetical protein